MHCTDCGTELSEKARFCKSCGQAVGSAPVKTEAVAATPSDTQTTEAAKAIIKCGSCGYVGDGERARNIFFTVLAWICVVFAPLITIIYFLATHKYRCPKCKSTFLGIKNEKGVFAGQRGGAGRGVAAVLLILLGIAILGILSSVVLASLNTARQEAAGTMSEVVGSEWQTYNSVIDDFSVLVPSHPTYETETDDSGEASYTYHIYTAKDGNTSFLVARYIYEDGLATSDPDALLEIFLNNFVNGTEGQLISSEYTYANGYRALDFHVSAANNENIKGRLILVGETPFMLGMDYFAGEQNEGEYQKFINSFSLK